MSVRFEAIPDRSWGESAFQKYVDCKNDYLIPIIVSIHVVTPFFNDKDKHDRDR